jgi:hypothetical protein
MFSPNPRVGSDGDRAWFRFTGEDDVAVEAKSAEVAGWLVVLGWYRTGSSDDASEEKDGLVALETDPESWGSEDGEVSTMRRRTICSSKGKKSQMSLELMSPGGYLT